MVRSLNVHELNATNFLCIRSPLCGIWCSAHCSKMSLCLPPMPRCGYTWTWSCGDILWRGGVVGRQQSGRFIMECEALSILFGITGCYFIKETWQSRRRQGQQCHHVTLWDLSGWAYVRDNLSSNLAIQNPEREGLWKHSLSGLFFHVIKLLFARLS